MTPFSLDRERRSRTVIGGAGRYHWRHGDRDGANAYVVRRRDRERIDGQSIPSGCFIRTRPGRRSSGTLWRLPSGAGPAARRGVAGALRAIWSPPRTIHRSRRRRWMATPSSRTIRHRGGRSSDGSRRATSTTSRSSLGTAAWITTGAPVPSGATAVVPVEATELADDHVIDPPGTCRGRREHPTGRRGSGKGLGGVAGGQLHRGRGDRPAGRIGRRSGGGDAASAGERPLDRERAGRARRDGRGRGRSAIRTVSA